MRPLLIARIGRGTCIEDLDASGDGKLSHDELERALVDLDIDITTSQAHALVMFMGEPIGSSLLRYCIV